MNQPNDSSTTTVVNCMCATILGRAPAIVAMHGFPDDSRIYDRLIGPLDPQRVVTFDWIGYGRSSRRDSRKSSPISRQQELLAVCDALQLEQAVLVGHDASGPEAIEFALAHPKRVARLVLLNTYYGRQPNLRLPEMIALMADPALTPLTDALVDDPNQRLWLLAYTGGRFGLDGSLPPDGIGVMLHRAAIFRRRQPIRCACRNPVMDRRSSRGPRPAGRCDRIRPAADRPSAGVGDIRPR